MLKPLPINCDLCKTSLQYAWESLLEMIPEERRGGKTHEDPPCGTLLISPVDHFPAEELTYGSKTIKIIEVPTFADYMWMFGFDKWWVYSEGA